ncbi:PleD family two-component system response regulator [Dolichospermum sp. UHCC 0259]|uniref:response regulator n=1 Tax=Dolichospermum sp. UHCC 0259 TaxID=2590010 RepID=UPI0014485A29|nr:hypothetical protein [Dolichospermum sp. UHCC 0259]MTJ50390.1 hypothetical protein [Dolichospermum sp. UHCC 0259]
MDKILVVESEIVLLELLAESLDLHGFCTITATSLDEGYVLAKQEKPMLILCGYSSNYLHSYEISYEIYWTFITKLRQDVETANIPLIFMAGSDLTTIPNGQNFLTSEDVLLKPFSSKNLHEKIYSRLHKISNPR